MPKYSRISVLAQPRGFSSFLQLVSVMYFRKELTALFEEEHANVLNFQRLQFLYSHR